MLIKCFVCEKDVPVPEYVSEGFEGQMRCPSCGALLEIEIIDGKCKKSSVFTDYVSIYESQ